MSHVVIKLEPYCWSNSYFLSSFGHMFTIVALVPYAVPFINNMILNKNASFTTFYLLFYAKLITMKAHIVQGIINWKRPFPECIPSIMSECGFPDPGIVFLIASVMISIFMTLVKYDAKLKYSYNKSLLEHILPFFKILRGIVGEIVFLIVQIITYCLVYNLAFLASASQIILSILYTTFLMLPMFWLVLKNMPKDYL